MKTRSPTMPVDEQNTSQTAAAVAQKPKGSARKRASKRSQARARRAAPRNRSIQNRLLARDYGGAATDLARRGKRLVGDAYGWVDEARNAVPRLAKGMHLPSPRAFESFVEANPVLLGAVGLGIGVVIGALLPRDAMHMGMQSSGAGGSSAPSPRRSGRKSAARK